MEKDTPEVGGNWIDPQAVEIQQLLVLAPVVLDCGK